MKQTFPNSQTIPLGVVVRRTPGVTRWAKFAWQVSDVLPGAKSADWKVLRAEGDVEDTVDIEASAGRGGRRHKLYSTLVCVESAS